MKKGKRIRASSQNANASINNRTGSEIVKPYFGIRIIKRLLTLVAKRREHRMGAGPGEAQARFPGWSPRSTDYATTIQALGSYRLIDNGGQK
jgi:hypothetical protein